VSRIRLVCLGVPENAGQKATVDIAEEFTHRPWHTKAVCTWDGSRLFLETENDYDDNGLASLDEFSDAISACIQEPFDGNIRIESVVTF
jgi:hypothetical protein